MLHEFTLSNGKAMINFTLKYCDTKQKLLNSYGFRRVIESFIRQVLKKEEIVIYSYYVDHFGSEENLADSFTEVFKLLTVFNIKEVIQVDKKYEKFFEDRDLFIEITELLLAYWKRLERYAIVHSNRISDGIQSTRFIQANTMFNELILATARRIQETVNEHPTRIYRQSTAGACAGITLNDVNWNCPIEYKGLVGIPFISKVVIQPPFISYTKKNTRSGLFQEYKQNPLTNIILNEDDWFAFPIKVGHMLTFVYFHRDFMVHGVSLSNLFEIATENEYIGKKPDIIYVFGYPDGDEDKRTFYYKDNKNDILIGYANHSDEIDYFGYMKKMLLTLHNVKQIEKGKLPIHGAMVNIVLKNGSESNIVIVGDSGAGKSESLEAFRMLNDHYIRHMRVVFDDMGYLRKEDDGTIKGYGTEIGAFVRIDDLDPAYAYEQMDRGIFTNPDKVNARVTIPISTYEVISKGYKVDIILYANNYAESDKKIVFHEDLNKSIEVFEAGTRKAKGTTSETGLVHSYFANPFGPVQEQAKTEALVRSYFKDMSEANVKIGEIYTSLAIEGKAKQGPREAAEELFKLINND